MPASGTRVEGKPLSEGSESFSVTSEAGSGGRKLDIIPEQWFYDDVGSSSGSVIGLAKTLTEHRDDPGAQLLQVVINCCCRAAAIVSRDQNDTGPLTQTPEPIPRTGSWEADITPVVRTNDEVRCRRRMAAFEHHDAALISTDGPWVDRPPIAGNTERVALGNWPGDSVPKPLDIAPRLTRPERPRSGTTRTPDSHDGHRRRYPPSFGQNRAPLRLDRNFAWSVLLSGEVAATAAARPDPSPAGEAGTICP